MSIASRITSIEGHISDIYDSVELTGVDTTDIDKNLVNVPNTLKEGYIDIINNGTDTLYNNFPKVSGEGTSLTLNNTYQAPMRNFLKGNTSQTGTPTPSSPIDVNVVSGDNEIIINSKNQLETYNVSGTLNGVDYTFQDGVLTLNGTCSSTGQVTGLGIFRQARGINYKWTYVYESGTCTDYGGGLYMGATPTSTTSAGYGAGFRTNQSRTVGSFTNGEEHTYYLYMALNKNYTFTNYKIKPLIVQGDEYSYDFEPYNGDTYDIDLPVENLLYINGTSRTHNGITFTINSDGSVTLQGISTDVAYVNLYTSTNQLLITDTSKTYIFSKGTTNNDIGLGIYDYISGWVQKGVDYTPSITYTRSGTETGQMFRILVKSGVTISTPLTIYPMLEVGTKVNKFVPYGTTPIELAEISTYNDEIFRTSGKNLYNKDTDDVGHVYSDTGNYGVVAVWTTSDWISVEPNERYHLSFSTTGTANIFFSEFDSSKTFIQRTTTSDFTPTNNTKYVRISFKNDLGTYDLQFEKGSSATEYNPYGTGEWYYKEAIKKVVLNGTETISAFDATSLSGSYQATFGITARATTTDKVAISDKFIGALISDRTTKTNIVYSYSDGYLRIATNVANTMAGFKTWLGTNNPKVLLEAATPTYNKITYEPLLEQLEAFYRAKSQEGQTNISQINNDLGFIISASALKKGV